METWRYRHRNIKTWRQGDKEAQRDGDIETWRHGVMETWRHGDICRDIATWGHGHGGVKWKTKNGSLEDFP